MNAYCVLLIGGSGFFGRRLAQRLSRDPLLRIIVAGRDLATAQKLVTQLNQNAAGTTHTMLQLDISHMDLAQTIRASGAAVVVHTSGPFQGQGYQVAQACIDAGVHYIDLADGREFVAGIGKLHEAAIEADVLVTSGASSVPALSSAVVDRLATGLKQLMQIDIGISPGNRTERGLATVQAILGYCGAPFAQWYEGRWQIKYGWQGMRRYRYPQPVGARWLAECDVPDLALFKIRYGDIQSVRFQAGLELPLLHFGMGIMSWLRRYRLVQNWSRYAPILKKLSEWLIGLGSDAGAMHLEVSGLGSDGTVSKRRWVLIALDGDGPYVPTLASAILVGQLAREQISVRGALPCVGLLTLADFETAIDGLSITMHEEFE